LVKESDSVVEFQDESLFDYQSEIILCPGCGRKVKKGTSCPICGYLQLSVEREQMEIDDTDDFNTNEVPAVIHPEASVGLEAVSVSEEADAEKTADSKSFLSGLRRFMGIKGELHTTEEDENEDQISEIIKEEDSMHKNEGNEALIDDGIEIAKEDTFSEEESFDIENIININVPEKHEDLQKEPVTVEPVKVRFVEKESDSIQDHRITEAQKNFLQNVSLNLWLLDLLLKGNIDKNQFNKMFDEYEAQLSSAMMSREKLLKRAREIDPLEKALNESKVYLEELKRKKELGKISEEEHDIKAPKYRWDINHYEGMISQRKAEEEYLTDLAKILSSDEIADMNATTERCKYAMENQDAFISLSPEKNEKVRALIERTVKLLDNQGRKHDSNEIMHVLNPRFEYQ
jgi:hypothetical protein